MRTNRGGWRCCTINNGVLWRTCPTLLDVADRTTSHPRTTTHSTLVMHKDRTPSSAAITAETVFAARDITKVYRMGDVEVHALRGVDLDSIPASWSCCWAPQAAANRRC